MNEYRVPELNVQNGVLKSLSFLFEYIGEMGKDYIYSVTPLLEDALMDRFVAPRSHNPPTFHLENQAGLGPAASSTVHFYGHLFLTDNNRRPRARAVAHFSSSSHRVTFGPRLFVPFDYARASSAFSLKDDRHSFR